MHCYSLDLLVVQSTVNGLILSFINANHALHGDAGRPLLPALIALLAVVLRLN